MHAVLQLSRGHASITGGLINHIRTAHEDITVAAYNKKLGDLLAPPPVTPKRPAIAKASRNQYSSTSASGSQPAPTYHHHNLSPQPTHSQQQYGHYQAPHIGPAASQRALPPPVPPHYGMPPHQAQQFYTGQGYAGYSSIQPEYAPAPHRQSSRPETRAPVGNAQPRARSTSAERAERERQRQAAWAAGWRPQ